LINDLIVKNKFKKGKHYSGFIKKQADEHLRDPEL